MLVGTTIACCFIMLVHATGLAFVGMLMPEAHFYQSAHAVLVMQCGTRGNPQVKHGQTNNEQLFYHDANIGILIKDGSPSLLNVLVLTKYGSGFQHFWINGAISIQANEPAFLNFIYLRGPESFYL